MDLQQRLKDYLVAGSATSYVESTGVQELVRTVRSRIVQANSGQDVERAGFRRQVEAEIWTLIDEESRGHFSHLMLSEADKRELFQRVIQSMFGFGPLEDLLHEPDITEIMVNGPSRVFIERGNRVTLALDPGGQPIRFVDEQELRSVIEKIVAPINKKVDESDPIVDARLPDGSRVSVALYPVSLSGTTLTVRRFPEAPYSLEDLVQFQTLPANVAELLAHLVEARYNMIVTGATGTGKTTFLNALSMKIPPQQRLVTVEDAAELRLAAAENLVRLESRPPNVEGKGEITIRALVRAALRMRPDRIIVGEVRGGEALDMLQAMNTGHDGSLTTVHANSAQDVISRLETMVLMSGLELPISAIRGQIGSAVDLIVHLGRLMDGRRCVTQIAQITRQQGEIQVEDLFAFNPEDRSGWPQLRQTGARLQRWHKAIRAQLPLQGLLADLVPDEAR